MKILALLDLKSGTPIEAVRPRLIDELKGSWALYTSGVLREVYATASPTRVVFILETADLRSAEHSLSQLPLVAAGLFNIELIELRAFSNWSLLFSHG
jgi:hypothetical protein